MSFTIKILFYLITSFCIAVAQILLSRYAKEISSPFCVSQWAHYSLSSHNLYGGILLYGISFVLFVMLLRFLPVAQVSVSILAFLMVIVFIYNYTCGVEFSLIQYLGGLMTIMGIIALNCKL